MIYCSSCGFQNEDAAKFCKSCGQSLSAAAPAPAPQPAAPVQQAQPTRSAAPNSAVHIRDGIISWPSTFIVQSYVEKVTTSVPLPAFPKLAILVLVAAILCFFVNVAFGVILLLVSIAWIAFWLYKRSTAPKGISIHLNSGEKTTIYLNDHAEANRIVDAIRDSISGNATDTTIGFTSAQASSKDAVEMIQKLNLGQ